jgi:hypothetical protein
VQGGQADRDPEAVAEGGQGQVRGVGHGLAEGGRVGGPERGPLGDRPAGGHLAGPLPAADDLPDPLGPDRVLAGEPGEGPAGVVVGEHADPEVERVGAHAGLRDGAPIISCGAEKRKTASENALAGC